jgi:hypothetical protein
MELSRMIGTATAAPEAIITAAIHLEPVGMGSTAYHPAGMQPSASRRNDGASSTR